MNRALALLLALSFVLSPVVARAGGGSMVLDPLPRELRSGDLVTLRWSGPPLRVDEMELLLSVDGGRSYPLRVSPELDPHTRSYRWRVPDVAAAEARLRIRIGHDDSERECPPSTPFSITAEPGAPTRRMEPGVTVHESGWWDGWDPPAATGRGALATGGVSFHVGGEPALLLGPERTLRGAGSLPPHAEVTVLPVTPQADPGPERRLPATRPSRVPMRN